MTTPPAGPYEYPPSQSGHSPASEPIAGHAPTAASAAGGTQPDLPAEPDQSPRKPRKWPWIIAVIVALFAGIGMGASAQDGGTDTDAPTQLEAERDEALEALATAEEQRDDALEDLAIAEQQRDTVQASMDEVEEERDAALARAEEAEDALATTEEDAANEAEEAEAAGVQFGDGTWVVGEDIEPGVYRNEGGTSCYWERLSGLSGEFGDIIANDNPDGPAVVEIASSDTAFSSQRCGTWSQQ